MKGIDADITPWIVIEFESVNATIDQDNDWKYIPGPVVGVTLEWAPTAKDAVMMAAGPVQDGFFSARGFDYDEFAGTIYRIERSVKVEET